MLLNEVFKSEEDIILEEIILENASMAWGKKGNEIVKKFRCLSGPRKGRLVTSASDCTKRLDLTKSRRMKKTIAIKGKKMARRAQRTKRVSPISKQVQKRNLLMNDANINEANVIGSAIHLNTIPKKYRQYELIGRGATSLVFKKDEDTVIMITRDPMKVDWLNAHDDTKYIEMLNLYHPIKDMSEKDVYVYEMPMMYKLSKENMKKVSAIVKKFQEYRMKFKHTELLNKLVELAEVEFSDVESFGKFTDFIINYNEEQFRFDPLKRNFMQNSDGEIILTDPVVDKEIVDLFMKQRR